MCIQVALNVLKLLLRGKKLNIGIAPPCWVRLSCERLSNIYYCCGCLGHTFKECMLWANLKEKVETQGLLYVQWLKAKNTRVLDGHK